MYALSAAHDILQLQKYEYVQVLVCRSNDRSNDRDRSIVSSANRWVESVSVLVKRVRSLHRLLEYKCYCPVENSSHFLHFSTTPYSMIVSPLVDVPVGVVKYSTR